MRGRPTFLISFFRTIQSYYYLFSNKHRARMGRSRMSTLRINYRKGFLRFATGNNKSLVCTPRNNDTSLPYIITFPLACISTIISVLGFRLTFVVDIEINLHYVRSEITQKCSTEIFLFMINIALDYD